MKKPPHCTRHSRQAIHTGLIAAFLAAAGVVTGEQNAQADGLVRCWGAGSSNKGSQNYGQSFVPADLGNCASVAGGRRHTIAMRSDGIVRCWGDDLFGQCDTPADLGAC